MSELRRRRAPEAQQQGDGIIDQSATPVENNPVDVVTPLQLFFRYCIVITAALVVSILYLSLTRLGLGKFFPPQPWFENDKPVLSSSALEVVAELPYPPGNVAVSASGRVFFTFHPEYNKGTVQLAETSEKSEWKAFPDNSFQGKFKSCLSLRVDVMSRLWVLDFANHGFFATPKLFGFQLANSNGKDELLVEHAFPSYVAGIGSMLNDFQVDPSGQHIFIVDTSIFGWQPALIVYSVKQNTSYRMLQMHPTLFGDSIFLNVSKTIIRAGPLGLRINVDSVALDRSGTYLYFGALTSNYLFAIATSELVGLLEKLKTHSANAMDEVNKELRDRIFVVMDDKPVTDGLTTDNFGNVWMTAVEHSALVLARPTEHSTWRESSHTQSKVMRVAHEFLTVVRDEKLLRWPDGLSFGPDGLYITCSVLQWKLARQDQDFLSKHGPFQILKLPKVSILPFMQGAEWPASGQ